MSADHSAENKSNSMKRVDAILLFFLFSLSCQKLSLSNEKVVVATASNFLETLVTLKKDFESNHDLSLIHI